MNIKKFFKNKRWVSYTVAACITVVFYLLASNISGMLGVAAGVLDVLRPVICGIIIAYIMNPVCVFFRDHFYKERMPEKMANIAAVFTGTVCIIVFFVILMVALVPQLVESVMLFASNVGSYVTEVSGMTADFSAFAEERGLDISRIVEGVMNYVNDFIVSIPEKANSLFAASYNVGMGIANLLLAFILAIYFLLDADNLLGGVEKMTRAFLSPQKYDSWIGFWRRCNDILIRYIIFDIVDGVIIGICNFIFMLIFSMPYSVMVSVVVGITNLAPTFGPIVGGVIGAFILVLVNPFHAIVFVVFTIILQTLDGYIIKPRLFGSSLGVPAVWILVTIIVGGKLFGVAGILLAIPFAAIVSYIYKSFIEKMIEEKGKEQAAKEKRNIEQQNKG